MPHNRRKLLLDVTLSCQEITDFIAGLLAMVSAIVFNTYTAVNSG